MRSRANVQTKLIRESGPPGAFGELSVSIMIRPEQTCATRTPDESPLPSYTGPRGSLDSLREVRFSMNTIPQYLSQQGI